MADTADPLDRITDKVELAASGCWLWTGAKTKASNGYGQIRIDGVSAVAHRVVYERLVEPIPEGFELDHLCRTRLCVNPDHLEPVTSFENFQRGDNPTAVHGRKTHCVRGHPLDGANLIVCNRGRSRRCRRCTRDGQAKRRSRGNG